MTDQDLAYLLEHTGERTRVGPAPIGHIVLGARRRRRRRGLVVATAGAMAVVTVLGGAAVVGSGTSTSPDLPVAHDSSRSVPATPKASSTANERQLSDEELALAVTLAEQEIESFDATITSATVRADTGTVMNSNTGMPCTSGRLLRIKLIGSFPHTVTTGHLVPPGDPTPDVTVRAALITADAQTGLACLIGVQTAENGMPEPAPDSTVLDLS
ncbi:hypothetical protein BH09ACT12_BH09ACT12_05420 [soil metagenome]